jgi:hypothetical protein
VNNQKLYLICDSVGDAQIEILTNESNNSHGTGVRFKGKFQEADTTNKNKRMYSFETLNREVDRLVEAVSERRLVGELDHPTDSIIHFENASHLITKLWWENKTLMGEGEILPTPAGKILESLIQSRIPVGISSRGVGTGKTNKEGIMEIGENYRLITFDVVADPSTHNAYANPIGETKTTKKITEKKSNKIQESSINTTIDPNIVVSFLHNAFKK